MLRGAVEPLGRVCDLGAGCGVLGLALAVADPSAQVSALELQPRLGEAARRNVSDNELGDRVGVLEVDLADARAMRAALPGGSFEWAVSNPPYRTLEEGPPRPDPEEAIARHELRMTLADLVREARRLLIPGGRAAVVYPSGRLVPLLSALDREDLRPVRLRLIHPRPGAPANRVLVEAHKGGRAAMVVEPPWFVRDESGRYTEEVARALGDAVYADSD